VTYFASAGGEAACVAQVVARQRTPQRTGRAHLVNTQMRVKPASPLIFYGRPPPTHRRDDDVIAVFSFEDEEEMAS